MIKTEALFLLNIFFITVILYYYVPFSLISENMNFANGKLKMFTAQNNAC